MTPRLPASSRKCRETRLTRAALLKRPSGRSRLLRNDPSTISSPATTAADPDKPGRPRSDRQPHNHSPPALTTARVQISMSLPPLRAASPVASVRADRSAAAAADEARPRLSTDAHQAPSGAQPLFGADPL